MSSDGHFGFRANLLLCGVFALGVGAAVLCPAQDVPPGGPPARARVVTVEDSRATDAFAARPQIVHEMLRRAILKFTGKTNVAAAWQSLLSPKDVVGLKVYSEPGANSGTRPAVVEAVLQGLLQSGLPPTNIIIWDKRLVDLRLAGFNSLADRYNVRLAGSFNSGYDDKVFYDNPVVGSLVAGDLEFDRDGAKTGRKSYVSQLLTRTLTKIISVAPLLNHNVAGVCGHLYSVSMGSIDNTIRFEAAAEPLARAVPEVYALPAVGDHVVLCITDALIGQYQGEQLSLLHYSTELNQIWLSKDPVASDVLAVQELDRERQARNILSLGGNAALFQNAALLELGVADPAKIRLDPVRPTP
ncbi:MAG: hypothetical protein ABSH38_12780 [Verrucomicrobiota bacterium]